MKTIEPSHANIDTKILDYNAKDYSRVGLTVEEIKILRHDDEIIFTITPAANKLPI